MNINILKFQVKMEKFIFMDAVLQASHMSKFQKKAKHIKRYELKQQNHTVGSSFQPNIIRYNKQVNRNNEKQFNLSKRKKNMSANQNYLASKESKQNMCHINLQNNTYEHSERRSIQGLKYSIKSKRILQQHQKIDSKIMYQLGQKQVVTLNQFFIKKQIQSKPRSARDYTTVRTQNLTRPIQKPNNRYFYDLNINLIKQRPKQCLIMPVSQTKSTREQPLKQVQNRQRSIREYVGMQIQAQKLKRKALCKTANSCIRHKATISKQTKKIEQQLRTRQLDEQRGANSYSQSYNQHFRHNSGLEVHKKNILPLSKEQIKVESNTIMCKYGVDMNKYFYKVHGQ